MAFEEATRESRRRCLACRMPTDEPFCPSDGAATYDASLTWLDPAAATPGTLIGGRYRVERRLGAGAFAEVLAARHATTGAEVALKILKPEEPDRADVVLARFFQEARILGRLTHPNTVRVYDFGQDEAGFVYLAMEMLRGTTLSDTLRARMKQGGAFEEPEVIRIAVAITRSLGEAHAQGLVHRDLKPNNVMLQDVDGQEPEVKVLDFGIAKSAGATLTTVGGGPCTPEFASPEQATGGRLDGRSDLYCLALTMFHLLTGRLPFHESSPLATLRLQVRRELPDIRSMALRPVSPALAAVIARAAAKSPDHRFVDAAAMRAALLACASAPAVSFEEPTDRTAPSLDPTRVDRPPLRAPEPGFDAPSDRTTPLAPGTAALWDRTLAEQEDAARLRRRRSAWFAGAVGALVLLAAAGVIAPRLGRVAPASSGSVPGAQLPALPPRPEALGEPATAPLETRSASRPPAPPEPSVEGGSPTASATAALGAPGRPAQPAPAPERAQSNKRRSAAKARSVLDEEL